MRCAGVVAKQMCGTGAGYDRPRAPPRKSTGNDALDHGILEDVTSHVDLPRTLGALLGAMTHENLEETLPVLLAHYSEALVFRDPIQTLHGRDAFARMNRSLASRSRAFHFELHDAAGAGSVVFLRWTMHMTPKLGRAMSVEGVSYLRTDERGLVVEHVDYWDLPTFFASAVPGGAAVLRTLLRPLA
jgi:hypothetical protein